MAWRRQCRSSHSRQASHRFRIACKLFAALTHGTRAEEELAAAQARARDVVGQEEEEEDDDDDSEDAGEGASSDDEVAEQDDAAAAAGPQGARGGRADASAQGACRFGTPFAAAAAEPFAVHCAGADGTIEAALAELDMEHYDDEDDEEVDAARLFGGSGRPTFYASNADDPHITLHEDDDEEELDDFTLRPTGASRLCGPSVAVSTDSSACWVHRPGSAGGSHGGRREPPGGLGV